MADELTGCLKADAATVIKILTSPPFNHTFVETFGDFTNGDLNLNTYKGTGTVGMVGTITGDGDKVVIHTRSP